jgi:hypothetical protein
MVRIDMLNYHVCEARSNRAGIKISQLQCKRSGRVSLVCMLLSYGRFITWPPGLAIMPYGSLDSCMVA